MINPSNTSPLRFLHIPKTAGTSMNVFLDRFYPPESMFVFNSSKPIESSLAKLRSMDPVARRSIKLFRGHAPLVVGEADVDAARTFTFLRDPVDRVVSFCHHLAEGKGKSHMFSTSASEFPEKDFELNAFLNSGEPELENLQTRMLVGEEDYLSLRQSGSASDLKQALSAAFQRIEFVGVQEQFEDSLLVASLIYKWWPPFTFTKRTNIRSSKVMLTFSDKQLDLIRRLNTMDTEAHRMASAIFSRCLKHYAGRLALLKIRIRCHKMFNPWRSRLRNRP
jgi:hypothetical protein